MTRILQHPGPGCCMLGYSHCALVRRVRPMARKKRIPEPKPLFKVGDRVSFPFGSGEVGGVIVEDRGCLGIGGRRLYGIRFELNPGDFRYVELPEVEMAPSRNLHEGRP